MKDKMLFRKSVLAIVGIVAIAAIFGMVANAQGATIYVDPTDPNAYSTIQDAIDNANDGDTIKVNPGIYKENVVISKPLKIVGDPIIDAHGGIGIWIQSNDTLVENMTIYNFSRGIYVHNDSFTIHNVTIDNCTLYNFSGGIGIYFENVERSIINNTQVNNTQYGISLDSASPYNLISNCSILNNGNSGISIYSDNNIVKNNNLSRNYDGIDIISSSNNNITNNIANSNTNYGIYLYSYSSNNIIENNTANNNGNYGIWIRASSNHNILMNNIENSNSVYGIYLSYSNNNVITNNTANSNEYGIYLKGSNNNVIRNSTFSNSYKDIMVDISSNNTFLNNTVASYPTTFDINGYNGNFTISGVAEPPAMPEGFENISKFLSITSNTPGAWLNITIYYEAGDVTVNEPTLHMWKWNGTTWKHDGWYNFHSVDTVNHVITVNITGIGDPIFAPLQDVTPPTTSISPGTPNYDNIWVNFTTPIWLNATDNAGGSGVNATYYRIWNGTWHPVDDNDEYCGNHNITLIGSTYWYVAHNATVDFNPIHFCEECKHYVEYYSVDNAGNRESIKNATFYVDNSPPEVLFDLGSPNYQNSTGANFTTSYTPIYLNATDIPKEPTKLNGTNFVWVIPSIAGANNNEITWTIHNFANREIVIYDWISDSTGSIPLNSLTWDVTGVTWNGPFGPSTIQSNTYYSIQHSISSNTRACLIRFNVSWNGGEEFARVIAEAIVYNNSGTWQINYTLINFDILNNYSIPVNDFELELYNASGAITPADIYAYYNGWGFPPEVNDMNSGIEIIWRGGPVEAGEWRHFGMNISKDIDLASVAYNWTVHCGVGSYKIYYRVWNSETGWSAWHNGSENESVVFTLASIGDTYNCTHYIEYYATDDLGNNYTEPLNKTVYVDNTPPESRYDIGEPSYYKSSESMWYVTTHTKIGINTSENYSDANACDSGCQYLHWEAYIWNESISNWEPINVAVWNDSSMQWENRSSGNERSNKLLFHFNEECHHKIVYYGVDNVGNREAIHEIEFKVDDTPPHAYPSIGVPSSGNHLTTHTDVQIIAADEGICPVGGYYIKYNIWNGTAWIYDWNNLPTYHNYNPIIHFTEECKHYLWVNASDELGNYNIYNWTFFVDDTPPTSSIDVTNHSFVSTSTILKINATDSPSSCASGVREIDYRISKWNGTNWEVVQDWTTGGSVVTFSFGENCTHRVEFYAVDSLENTETIKWYVYYVDTTPPTTNISVGNPNITAGSNSYYVTTNTHIWLNTSDAGCNGGAGVAELHYTIIYNGIPHNYVIQDNEMGDWDNSVGNISVNISFNEQCNHTLEYWSVDNVGNEEQHHIIYFLVDDTPPMINQTIGEPNITKDGKLFITSHTPIWVNATDLGLTPECTVGSIHLNVSVYSLDAHQWTYYETSALNGWASIGAIYINEECVHWINITAWDDLNNTVYYNETVYVDNTPPVLNKDVGWPKHDNGNTYITSQTPIYLNITDDGSTPECTVGSLHVRVGIWNGTWNYTWYNVTDSPLNLTMFMHEECMHWLNVTMYDDLGNVAYDNETFYVDNSKPEGIISIKNATSHGYVLSPPLWVNVTANDMPNCAASGIKNVTLYYRYSCNNATWSQWQKYDSTLTTSPYSWYFQNLQSGFYQFYAAMYDNLTHFNTTAIARIAVPLNITYKLYEGWNLITVPINVTWHAWDLANYINQQYSGSICRTIVMFNPLTQRYTAWIDAMPYLNNFSIHPGVGYWVYIDENITIAWKGMPVGNISIQLQKGYNIVGWIDECHIDTNISVALRNITNATMAVKFNASNQDYSDVYIPPNGVFDIHIGDAFYVYCQSKETWMGRD